MTYLSKSQPAVIAIGFVCAGLLMSACTSATELSVASYKPEGAFSLMIDHPGVIGTINGCVTLTTSDDSTVLVLFPEGDAAIEADGTRFSHAGVSYADGDQISLGGSISSDLSGIVSTVPQACIGITVDGYLLVDRVMR